MFIEFNKGMNDKNDNEILNKLNFVFILNKIFNKDSFEKVWVSKK